MRSLNNLVSFDCDAVADNPARTMFDINASNKLLVSLHSIINHCQAQSNFIAFPALYLAVFLSLALTSPF